MGMFDRAGNDNFDVAPQEYLPRCQNCIFPSIDGVQTREGGELKLATGLASIRRSRIYKRLNEADRFLILDATGKLFDSGNSLVTPILNIPAMTDFALQVMFNRAYISPHNSLKGLPGEFLYVYEGTGVARKAAGLKPTGFTIIAATGATGNIERGTRLFAVVYETASGHFTQPGPDPFVAYTYTPANGVTTGVQVNLSAIAAGPAGTIFKHVVATKAAPEDWTGNVQDLEFFFIPDVAAKLSNATTTYTANFYDAELVDSADFLFDEFEEIKAGVGLFEFNGRLGIHTEDAEESMVRLSVPGYPESINEINGFLKVLPFTGGKVTCCVEHRESLYIHKDQRTYHTMDNGSEPSTWKILPVDKAKGTPSIDGAGQFFDDKGSSSDWFPVADRSGLYAFTGSMPGPEAALSAPISGFWKRIDKTHFYLVKVKVDPILSRIYVSVPLDNVTINNCILVCDYAKGLDANSVRWSLWVFPINTDSIEVDVDFTTKETILFISAIGNGNIYRTKDGLTDDWASAIDSYTITAGLGANETGNINHYAGIRSRVRGSGSLAIKLIGSDAVQTLDVPGWTLSLTTGGKQTRKVDFEGEAMYVQFRTNAVGHWFHWNELTVFGIPVWEELPT